ncbi:Stk1 family PASTA domain-containing Ser/Thr kinase [Zongyangia hominis]|uniref:non-specific serine/threonine protein kinase n=1 Tax=Zongyangia hominis TaxID=2763677 RepID=A0A926ED70_9FIRM|nr:Stk1 family PASTA domain-containing Ser/Thr kinase [Zongyangia hominis]MBC8570910.1 Stk1 family PASTA domain-containing Ser/Thr kinase [Zongyangia hominis]
MDKNDKYIGKRLDGRYEVLELIGVGGMANVYKAHDIAADRMVAVKILREEYLSNEELLRRFKNESKAIAVLSHPNIVKVYDVIFADRIYAIVMEHIDGITLKEYIEQQHVLKWKEAVHFTVQILRALQHAHDKGIVHRDIKPQNIMLLEDGTIKMMDFGIARFARSETRTITDRAIGSVHYISPEQACGEVTDEKTDLYSVGVMLFEMLTGELPFDADRPVTVAIQQIQAQPKRPRQINPDIPEGLEEITVRAMQKDRTRRYQSAAEMLHDIDEFKKNPSIQFEYRYMQQEPQYKRAISTARKQKTEDTGNKKSPAIPIMGGITLAFVIIAILFVVGMVWLANPFAKVEEVVLPDFVGLKYESIVNDELYKDFKFEVEIEEPNDTYDKGLIFDQNPKQGKTVKVGSKVKIKVSSGKTVITIPPVAGVEATLAAGQLSDLGLEVSQKTEYSSDVAAGEVIRTDPVEGTEVGAGTSVILYVSLGAEEKLIDMPNVTDIQLETARKLLQQKGLKVNSVKTDPDSDKPSGTVIAQEPQAGSQIKAGSAVTLTISGSGSGESGSGEGSEARLFVPLPMRYEHETNLTATLNDQIVYDETVIPSEDQSWQGIFKGNGIGDVKVYLNGKLYMQWSVNFDENTAETVVDNSSGFDPTP